MTPAALAAMLGADGLRRARAAADRSHPAQIQTDAGLLRTDPVGPQERDHALPAPSARMDQVAALPAPRFDDKTQLPAPAAYRADEMPAYNAAELPAQADPMTLDQVYMMALQNDPQLRGAYQELQAVGYGVMAARAGLLPSVTGEANRSRVKQNVINSQNAVYQTGQANWNENGWALTLTQPILDLGAFHKWRQAQEAERKEVASYAYAQQDLMLRTATAYLSILAAQDQIELTEAERNTQKQMELVRARYRSGQETEVGVSEVQARLDLQEANTLLARHDYLDKQQGPAGNHRLRQRPTASRAQGPAHGRATAQRRAGLAAHRAGAELVDPRGLGRRGRDREEVSVQRAGYYPSMALRASTGRNETGGSLFGGGSTVGDTRVTLNLSVPIFQSGYTYGMSHAAASRLGAASSELSLARRKVQRQVFSFQNIVIGMDRIKALDSSVQSFELALRQKEEGFKAGLNDVVSVLDATRNLYNAKRQQAEAGYNFVLDGLKLKQAAGTLNAADIAAISQQIL